MAGHLAPGIYREIPPASPGSRSEVSGHFRPQPVNVCHGRQAFPQLAVVVNQQEGNAEDVQPGGRIGAAHDIELADPGFSPGLGSVTVDDRTDRRTGRSRRGPGIEENGQRRPADLVIEVRIGDHHRLRCKKFCRGQGFPAFAAFGAGIEFPGRDAVFWCRRHGTGAYISVRRPTR